MPFQRLTRYTPERSGLRGILAGLLVVALPLLHQQDLPAASRTPVRARHGMVGSASPLATAVGLETLEHGGNAVDAAVAVGFALAVTHPEAGNIGGGGFMVIRLADGRETTIDFRERAPERATADMFLDASREVVTARSRVGALASGVPGSVAGLTLARARYGTRPLAELLAPAIRLARDGYDIGWEQHDSLASHAALLSRFPATARIFLRPDGSAREVGERLVQADLARTLQLIAEGGADAFYRGPIAERIAAEMATQGGLISRSDLAGYEAVERPPVTGTYRGCRVVSMGPPSSGGVALVELLNVLEGFRLDEAGALSTQAMHLIAEAERRVFADRAQFLGDPDFVRMPVAGLTSKGYAETVRRSIDPLHATPSAAVRAGSPAAFESLETTHYSVVDAAGNAVAVTTTINGGYGNGEVVDGAGFLLNNEMDDFSARPGAPNADGLVTADANAIAPRKRMLSSMTPTIVVRDGRTWLVVGSPGSGRIITTVAQVIVNLVDFGMNVQEAVDSPRFHHQWQPDRVDIERRGFAPDVLAALRARGHEINEESDMGNVQAILIDPATGLRLGASDPRGDGVTMGY